MEKTAAILWQNVKKLMEHRYGEENLNALVRDTGIGPGTATRIKEQKTSVGLDTLEKLATPFKLQPYQLLVRNLNPKAPQVAIDRQYVATARRMAKELTDMGEPE